MNDLELWDDKQLAEKLSVAPQTPRVWRLRGGGPPFLRIGRRIRYRPEDVAQFIADQPRYQSTSQYPVKAVAA
ncbi:MAG: helix-turn-helix domain-containing protein [Acidobacteria bacterium]|nr:helix-turn-helix domain-containing protein [Acidobacteriota bacterium]